jgi:cytochrome c oxidase subunit 3/cytochrome o ubiquinol oxidase subunit 3
VTLADVSIERSGHGEGGHTAEHATTTGLPSTKLAMWLFLASECLLFGALISTYILYRGADPLGGPTPEDVFDIPYTSVSSFVLLASSLTMVLALAAAQKRDTIRMRLWLLATALLGLSFVGGQVYEFTVFYNEGLALDTNLFGTTFYVLTGIPRRPRDGRDLDAAVARRHVVGRPSPARRVVPRRDGRPVLALRRHRVDRDLHRCVPDPLRSAGGLGVRCPTS